MARVNTSRVRDRRVFSRTSSRTKSINYKISMRGGIRL